MNKKALILAVLLFIGIIPILNSPKNKVKNKKNKKSKSVKKYDENTAREQILYALKTYGKYSATMFEKMLRLETAHFKSGQYRNTGTPGMEVGKWSLGSFEDYVSSETYAGKEGATSTNKGGTIKKFVIWNDPLKFVDWFHWFIKNKRNGDFAAWYSLNPESQKRYIEKLSKISAKIVNNN